MIEVLIDYIQKKGFQASVIPGVLLIRKHAKGQRFGMDWAIPADELQPEWKDELFDMADHRMALIDAAIARTP